jgi:hypothetical protein
MAQAKDYISAGGNIDAIETKYKLSKEQLDTLKIVKTKSMLNEEKANIKKTL